MEELIKRWESAARRASEEQVRVLELEGQYRATSSSHALGSYLLQRSPLGWTCECVANREYGLPCKHLWALAEALGLDVLSDMDVSLDAVEESHPAA